MEENICKDFSWFTLPPLLAAAFYSLAMVLTRSKCQGEAPLTLALALHGASLAIGLIATMVLASLRLDTGTQAARSSLLGDWAPIDRKTGV